MRAPLEPRDGLCDAIFVTPVFLGNSLGELKAKGYAKGFGLVVETKFTPPKSQSAEDTQKSNVTSSSHLSPTTASSSTTSGSPHILSEGMKNILKNPLGVSCTESNTTSALKIQTPADLVSHDGNTLLLSGFVVEYKKWKDDATKALNQERTYLVSAVTHLATLGIKGFPVFGLVTSGQVGGILMAWWSEVHDVCVLVISDMLPVFLIIHLPFTENLYY